MNEAEAAAVIRGTFNQLDIWHAIEGALLRCSIAGHAEAGPGGLGWSDGRSEFVECGGQPEHPRGVDCKLVLATTQVLDEGVALDHYARRSLSPQPPHRPEPGLQAAVVAFDSVVLVLAGVMQRRAR